MAILDSQLIAECRLAAALSQPTLARLLNVSTPVITRLEAGVNHDNFTLAQLRLLADALGLTPKALVAEPPPESAAHPDDIRVEAALALVQRRISSATLAKALGWTPERVTEALAALSTRQAG